MTKRTFIAIKINPTENLLYRIYYLKKHLSEDNINWIKIDHFHITLRFIGDTPIGSIESISKSIEKVMLNYHSFDLNIKGISVFGSHYKPKIIWAGVEPKEILQKIAESIDKELCALGFEIDRQNFVPHLTLGRIRKLKDKSHFFNVIEKPDSEVIQTETVKSVVFFESQLKQNGAVYNVLDQIQLKP